ncbi:MAG: bifunctional riboflavin kinase/FAD synthetase [Eubacteriaceae bacterium]|nr:bifunctional riboflavin kinase/FAD synthetase [Eubacteriaceae bacterium]
MVVIKGFGPSGVKEGIALAIGNFDGMHIGHKQVIGAAIGSGYVPGVATFCNLNTESKSKGSIMSLDRRLASFKEAGVGIVFVLEFNEELRNMSPSSFIGELFLKNNIKQVVVGYNFVFGAGRQGDTSTLSKLCAEKGVKHAIVGQVDYKGSPVSSTRIKAAIAAGEMRLASEMLDKPFTLSGEVVIGRSVGRTIGIPTANIHMPPGIISPKFGVYATIAQFSGESFSAVTNVGVKPTFGDGSLSVETHIIGYNGDLYGEEITISFIDFVRPEQKFPSVDALKKQIEMDTKAAASIISMVEGGAKPL